MKTCIVCERADPYRPDLACLCRKCAGYFQAALHAHIWSEDLAMLKLFGTAVVLKKADDNAAEKARNSIEQLDLTDLADDKP